MAQNKYDSPDFFSQYSKLPRSMHGLDSAPEWPTLRRMVGDVTDASVLDLGCGYGWFCRWARGAGARSAHGVDVSAKMLARAQEFAADAGVTYERADLERIALPAAAYDVAYSSLALHYLPDLDAVFAQVARALRPGGRFVFSVEHPVMAAPSDPAWKRDAEGNLFWPLNRYIDEGLRLTSWLGAAEVRKYHHMVQTYLTVLIAKGFVITAFKEVWDELERKSAPDEPESGHRPFFLMIGARIPGGTQ